MIINPTKEFRSITVSCFDVPLATVWQEFELSFTERRMNVSGKKKRLAYEDYGPSPMRGGKGLSVGGLFTPGLGVAPGTVLITNLIDGWQTLAMVTSKRLGCSCWRFTVCTDDEDFPRTAFALIQAGVAQRTVSVQLDTQWIFLAKGDVLPIETETTYARRRIKDRVTSEYVLSIATKAGFPIGEDAFWRTDESSIRFESGVLASSPGEHQR
jgi:hypothetical protein